MAKITQKRGTTEKKIEKRELLLVGWKITKGRASGAWRLANGLWLKMLLALLQNIRNTNKNPKHARRGLDGPTDGGRRTVTEIISNAK